MPVTATFQLAGIEALLAGMSDSDEQPLPGAQLPPRSAGEGTDMEVEGPARLFESDACLACWGRMFEGPA